MADSTVNLNITGDAGGALAAIAETQAAIDRLNGKTVLVTVETRGSGGAVGDLNPTAAAPDRASSGHGRYAQAAERAADSMRDHATASSRARDGMRDHAAATDRASDSTRRHNDETERGNETLDRSVSQHERASSAVEDHARQYDNLEAAAERHQRLVDGMGSSAAGTAKNFDDMWKGFEGKSFPGFAPVSEPARPAPSGPTIPGRAPSSEPLPRTPNLPSTNEPARVFQMPDMPARLDAVRAATDRLQAAQTRAASTATTYHQAFDEAFRSAPEGVDALRHAEKATQGLRDEMTSSNNAFRSAKSDLQSLADVLTDSDRSVRKTGDGVLGLAGGFNEISGVAGTAGRAVGVVGMAALYSAAGMGILAGATAGIGMGAGVLDIMKSAPLMAEARRTARLAEDAFQDMGGKAATVGLGPMKALEQGVVGVSKQLAQVGVSHLPETLGAASSIVDQFSGMVKGLEPSISPATRALVSLSGAVMGGIGQSSGAINTFSNAVSANADGIQSFVAGGVHAMSSLGTAFTNVVGTWGPRLEAMEPVMDSAGDFVAGLFGGKSNMANPMSTETSGANRVGEVLGGLGLGAIIGGAAGGLLGAIFGGGIGAVPGAIAGAALFGGAGALDAQFNTGVASQSPEMVAGQRMHATTNTGSTAPWYPAASKASDDPWALQGTGARQGEVPKPLAPAGAVSAPPPGAASSQSGILSQHQNQLTDLPRFVGSSGGLSGTTGQVAALNQELNRTTNMAPLVSQGMSNVGQAAQQSMQQAGSAATQAAPQFQQGLGQMQQHAQQLPPQLGSTMSMLGPALQQPMQQAMPQAAQAIQPQPIADAAGAAVSRMVRQVQPQAEQGGQDIGASIPSGTSQGITKDVEKVVTIVEHLVTRVIQAAATALDAHSPSRVFAALGASIPQGLAVGMESDASLAVSATERLMGQSINSAQSQLTGMGNQPMNIPATIQPSIAYPGGPGQLGNPALLDQQKQQQQQLEQAQKMQASLQQLGLTQSDLPGLSPDLRARIERGESVNPGDQANIDQFKKRKDQLQKFGWSEDTLAGVQRREEEHNRRAQELRERRAVNHDAALFRSQNPNDPLSNLHDRNSLELQAQNWRDKNPDQGWSEQYRAGADKQRHEMDRQAQQSQKDMEHAQARVFGGRSGMLAGQAERDGQESGKAFGAGTFEGVMASLGKVGKAARNLMGFAEDEGKKKAGIASPSKVWSAMGGQLGSGLAGGMTSAFTSATDGIEGIASDRALQIGYRWATDMATGARSIMKTDLFQNAMVPNVTNEEAMTALGAGGWLPDAGSGAQIWKNQMATIGGAAVAGSGGTQQAVIHNHLYIDGDQIRLIAGQEVTAAFDYYAGAKSRQVH